MMPKAKITVTERANTVRNASHPDPYYYTVVKRKNTTSYPLDSTLTKAQCDELIRQGIEIDFVRPT
jgi:hypothetical protein